MKDRARSSVGIHMSSSGHPTLEAGATDWPGIDRQPSMGSAQRRNGVALGLREAFSDPRRSRGNETHASMISETPYVVSYSLRIGFRVSDFAHDAA
jgi:hypothetical protein